jgi:hypothetical protein
VTLQSAVTVIEVSAADLQTVTDLYITSNIAGAVLVINVADSGDVSLDSLNLYLNGVFQSDTSTPPAVGMLLINYCNAATLDFSGSIFGSILAPTAAVTYSSGVLWGNLIVGSLHSKGTSNGCNADGSGNPIPGESGQVNNLPTEFNVAQGQSGQMNNLPFNPICPPVPEVGEINLAQKKNAQAERLRRATKQANKGTKQARKGATVQDTTDRNAANVFGEQAKQQPSAQWMWAAGGAVGGIALSALVAAGVAFNRRSRSGRRSAKRSNNGSLQTPQTGVAQSPAAWSPQSTVSRRGSSRFPLSP